MSTKPNTHTRPRPASGPLGRRRYKSTLGPQTLGASRFVALSAEDEERAVDALAELLAPLIDAARRVDPK